MKHLKKSSKDHSGRWTKPEHKMFLDGLRLYNRNWKLIADYIKTRTSTQVRSHAQKYFIKLSNKNPHEQLKRHVISSVLPSRTEKKECATQYGEGMIFPLKLGL